LPAHWINRIEHFHRDHPDDTEIVANFPSLYGSSRLVPLLIDDAGFDLYDRREAPGEKKL
jgi:hypothetical protein